ncbi:threonine/serine exporter family protein [Nocardioides marmoraquaticus]
MSGVSDVREAYRVLDLALRVGEILLSSGAGAADVTATMLAITEHGGLRQVDVDVTFTALRLGHQLDTDEPPLLLSRTVVARDLDYDDLTKVQGLVNDLLNDRVDVVEARRRIAWINSAGHNLPGWAATLVAGVVGGAVSLILDGDALVVAVATVAGTSLTVLMRYLARERWPMFYQQAAGGFVATLLALVTDAVAARFFDVGVSTSLVITANVVMLLAGIGFLGAVQDALTGFYLTAAARSIEALLATAGLIAGVSAGLALGPPLGVSLYGVRPGRIDLAAPPLVLVGAIVAACAFALTCYAPWRALPAIAASTLAGHVAYLTILQPSDAQPWAAATAAVVIGVLSFVVAGRVRVPPLVVVVPALVPLLPGLALFRGLSLMSDGNTLGILQLTTAAATTIALSAGVILGEYLAQPLKRNARRLEDRLSGPRLVGATHRQLRTVRERA